MRRNDVTKRKEKSAAIVTIHNAPKMTAKGRRDIAKWLRMHADRLVDGKKFVKAGKQDHTLLWRVEVKKKT